MLALAAAACGSAQPDRNASPPTSTSTSDSASAASASATPTPSVATVETSGPAPTASAGAPTPPLTVESAVASLGLLPGLSRSGAVVACIDEARGDGCGTRAWIEQSARIALVGIDYVGGNDVMPWAPTIPPRREVLSAPEAAPR